MADETAPAASEKQTLADAIRVLAKMRAQSRGSEPSQAEKDAQAQFEAACGELTEAYVRLAGQPEEHTEPASQRYAPDSDEDGLAQLLATYCQPPVPNPEDGASEP